jgi:O-antigen ligase
MTSVDTGVNWRGTIAAFLLLIYPGLMFAVKGGMNGVFLLLLLLSVLPYRPRSMQPWDRDATYYLLAMASLPVAIFLSQSYNHHYSGHPYDAASRFLLGVPVFMMLRNMRFKVIAMVQYGFPLATIVGCLMLKQIDDGRYGISTLDLIHFGDFALVMGVLSVLCLDWTGRDALLLRLFKIAGFAAGIYASVASGSRGGWIAMPVFLMIFICFRMGKVSIRTLLMVPFMLVIAGLIAYASSHEIHQRVDDLLGDVTSLQHGNPDTSTGIRLQLFKAAASVFVQHPFFGVGPEGFAKEMDVMERAGTITHLAADLGRGEVHNELLSKAAGMGVFGLAAMLAIYLVPAGIFYRSMRSSISQIRQSGMLGLIFVSGFIIFGLTAETLNLTMATAFYSLTVAVLLAACLNAHRGAAFQKDHHV